MRKTDPVKRGEKRQEILQAATRTFLRDGLQRASISGICKSAGISPGHLYHYFASKEEILEAIAEHYLAMTREGFSRLSEAEGVIPTLLAEIESATAGSRKEGQALMFELIAEASRSPRIAAIMRDSARQMKELMTELVRNGQERGEIRDTIDPELLASTVISLIDGIKVGMASGNLPEPRRNATFLASMLDQAIRSAQTDT